MIKKCALFFLLGMFCISELSADPHRWFDARTFSLRAANQLPVTALSFPEEIVSPGQYYGALLGLDASSELRITSYIEDRAGRNFRFQQYYRGLQVFGARLVVNEHSDGRIKAMGGRVAREIDLDPNLTQGSLTASRALNRALEHYRAEHGEGVLVSESDATLVVAYADDRYHLAFLTWAFGRTSESGLPVRPTALVDGNSGEIIQAWDSLRR